MDGTRWRSQAGRAYLSPVQVLASGGCAAVGLGGVIMKGELDRRKAWQVVFRDPASGQLRRLESSPRVMLRWLLHKYPIQACSRFAPYLDSSCVSAQLDWSQCTHVHCLIQSTLKSDQVLTLQPTVPVP